MKSNPVHIVSMLGWRGNQPWFISCSEAALLLGDSPFVPMLCEAVMTLFNEYILPLLAGEENTQAFSSLASAGVDVEAAMLYHMWEMQPDNCRIAMTQSQVLDMFQFVFLHDCDSYTFPPLNSRFCKLACPSNPSSGLQFPCWLRRWRQGVGGRGQHPCHVNAC